ncbi:CRISPR-associated protein Csx16 [Vibrio sp.]|nr:CRISPR-associated protein Csx16 [Vibrio sp.]
MTITMITRHPASQIWMENKGIKVDRQIPHLFDVSEFGSGDTVIGILPINIIADLTKRGVNYWHFTTQIPESLRGKELSYDELITCKPRIIPFVAMEGCVNTELALSSH